MDSQKTDICPENILIVDDSTDNLRLLSDSLRSSGYKVRHAINASMALMGIEAAVPDLILLDIKMPEIDGYELCQQLKSSPITREIPIIFLSALDEAFDKVRAFAVGGSDYITKPFQIEEVLARIKNQLTICQLQKQLIQQNAKLEQQIEQRQQKEQQLQQAKQKAELASSAKMEFIAKMSHELRTPLNAILGFTQLMIQDPKLNQEHQEYISIIHRSGEHLLSLINDVLEISKIQAGKTKVDYSNFDLYNLLAGLIPMWEMQTKAKGLSLTIECTPDLPKYIKGDHKKLKQIFINLVGNAIKFTETGGVTLKITRLETKDRKDRIAINFVVEDTGPGIAPTELEHLFEPFVQTSVGNQYEQGTGLGLTISRELVQLMGGKLTVKSRLNEGTIFEFNLPIQLSETAELSVKKSDKRIVGIAPGQPEYRILVAEDDWSNRKLLVKMLEPMGFQVREAQNGQEAIQIWKDWQPHLIYMDLKMPVMDGYQAINCIKKDLSGRDGTIVIAMSASLIEESTSISAIGCDDFIRKPFQQEIILNKISQHLGVRYLYEELSLADQKLPFILDKKEEENIIRKSLNMMSREWLAQLHNIARQLDPELVLNLLAQVPQKEQMLADYIKDLVNNFRFDIIMNMTQKALSELDSVKATLKGNT